MPCIEANCIGVDTRKILQELWRLKYSFMNQHMVFNGLFEKMKENKNPDK
jgi:hypothetical protein